MKKNNKGFTLIEIIAVVVIIGIMAIIAVPRIYSLISNSKNDVYVQDAKRFISKTQYEMNAGNQKIDKPDLDECIIVSLNYLNDSDFKHAPNNGVYLPDASFVVVRNVNGKYYYSAMLVEKMQDNSYIGVELSSELELSHKSATSHVRAFTEDEILYINDSVDDKVVTDYINNNIKVTESEKELWYTEQEEIIGYYYTDIPRQGEDDTSITSPRITAKFGSTNGSLQTSLSVTVTDSDDKLEDLVFCMNISHDNNIDYPDPLNNADYNSYCVPYGSNLAHVVDIDLSASGYDFDYNDSHAFFYLSVMDTQSNVAHKKLVYDIHGNEAPVISSFEVVKLDEDVRNFPKAKVIINVSDDLDKLQDLKVCFIQDESDTRNREIIKDDGKTPIVKPLKQCSKYLSFYDVFNEDGVGYYTFKDLESGKDLTIPDGSKHSLRIQIKDSYGLITKADASYEIYENMIPIVRWSGVVNPIPIIIDGKEVGNSLTGGITLSVIDDISGPDKITLEMDDIKMTYAEYLQSDKLYTFAGPYDGKDRYLSVTVSDEFGASRKVGFTLTNVYKTSKPNIEFTSIKSSGAPCNGANTCFDSANGGNISVSYTLSLYDDLTPIDDLLVCVSEIQDDCDERAIRNFVRYGSLKRSYTFSKYSDEHDYPPQSERQKRLYAAVIDGDGNYATIERGERYSVYHNFAPEVTGSFNTSILESTPTYVKIGFDLDSLIVEDDFSSYSSCLCYKYGSDKDYTCGEEYREYSNLKAFLKDGYSFNNGKGDISMYFSFKDNYGAVTNSDIKVQSINEDEVPTIESLVIESSETNYNSNVFNLKFKVLDLNDEYKICISDKNNSCLDYSSTWYSGTPVGGNTREYSVTVDGNEKFNWSSSYEEEDVRKTVYLYVKDRHDNVVSSPVSYIVYKLCSNKSGLIKKLELKDYRPLAFNDNPIDISVCLGACYHNYETTTNTSHINHLSGSNDYFGQYEHSVVYIDSLVQQECTKTEGVSLYCDYSDCFQVRGKNVVGTYVDLNIVDENTTWAYTTTKVTNIVNSENPLCVNPPSEPLFNMNDYRCTDPDYCETKVTAKCISECENNRLIEEAAYNQERDARVAAYEAQLHNEYDKYYEYCQCLESNKEGATCNTIIGSKVTGVNCSDWTDEAYNSFINSKVAEFLDDYPPFTYNCPDPNNNPGGSTKLNPAFTACIARERNTCQSYLSSFCNESTINVKYQVDCDDPNKTDGPFICDANSYTDGKCLSNQMCVGEYGSCPIVCYRSEKCDYQEVEVPTTFLCHGYFKTYKAETVNNKMTLKETGMRVCPDFYRLYPNKFKYDNKSLAPYVLFNSLEQEGE